MSAAGEQLTDLWLRSRAWYAQREPRERIVLTVGAGCLLLALAYALVVAPLQRAVQQRSQRIEQKRTDLAWMQSVLPQVAAFSNQPTLANSSAESMVVLIANTASAGSISNSLAGQTPDGPNSVRIRFDGVQFDALVIWLGALQKDYGIRTTAAEINRGAQPGQVSAALTLQRAGS